MLTDIIRDVNSVTRTFQLYGGDKSKIPPEILDRNMTLAGSIILRVVYMLTGYRESTVKSMCGKHALAIMMHIRKDVYEELEGAGLLFNYLYEDQFIVGLLVDNDTGTTFRYTLTSKEQTKEIGELRWMLEMIPCTVN